MKQDLDNSDSEIRDTTISNQTFDLISSKRLFKSFRNDSNFDTGV